MSNTEFILTIAGGLSVFMYTLIPMIAIIGFIILGIIQLGKLAKIALTETYGTVAERTFHVALTVGLIVVFSIAIAVLGYASFRLCLPILQDTIAIMMGG